MFEIKLQTNNSENITITKDVTDLVTLQGTLRDATSITDPEFLINADWDDISACNYITVDAFNRSYFVTGITNIRTGLVMLTCHVDVLSSFADEIKANKGIVRRSESKDVYNLYLNDGSLMAYQDPYILTEPFPNGFDSTGFVLAVAGA